MCCKLLPQVNMSQPWVKNVPFQNQPRSALNQFKKFYSASAICGSCIMWIAVCGLFCNNSGSNAYSV